MHFIDRHQRWIALVVAFAFFYLIRVSAAPIPANQAPAAPAKKTLVSSEIDHPGSVEKPAPAYSKPRKSNPIIGIVIAVVLIGAIAAVLLLVVFKTKYDITGPWKLSWYYAGHSSGSNTITFVGTKKAGSFAIGTGYGTYIVDGKKVNWIYATSSTTYTGTFSEKNVMSGNVLSNGVPGTWTATRVAAAGGHNENNLQKKNNGEAK